MRCIPATVCSTALAPAVAVSVAWTVETVAASALRVTLLTAATSPLICSAPPAMEAAWLLLPWAISEAPLADCSEAWATSCMEAPISSVAAPICLEVPARAVAV